MWSGYEIEDHDTFFLVSQLLLKHSTCFKKGEVQIGSCVRRTSRSVIHLRKNLLNFY